MFHHTHLARWLSLDFEDDYGLLIKVAAILDVAQKLTRLLRSWIWPWLQMLCNWCRSNLRLGILRQVVADSDLSVNALMRPQEIACLGGAKTLTPARAGVQIQSWQVQACAACRYHFQASCQAVIQVVYSLPGRPAYIVKRLQIEQNNSHSFSVSQTAEWALLSLKLMPAEIHALESTV